MKNTDDPTTSEAPEPYGGKPAANRRRSLIPITIGGKTRHLRYDLNALAVIEERLGLAGIGEIQGLMANASVRTIRAILWAGLMHEEESLEEREVGSWDMDIPAVARLVADALGVAFSGGRDASESADQPPGNARRPKR